MLSCRLQPSTILQRWIIIWALVLLLPPWFSALPTGLLLLIDLGLILWLCWALPKYHWQGDRVLIHADKQWSLKDQNGDRHLDLVGEYYLSRWLIVLHFRGQQPDGSREKITLVILPDSADPDELRRLRVLLKQLPLMSTT